MFCNYFARFVNESINHLLRMKAATAFSAS